MLQCNNSPSRGASSATGATEHNRQIWYMMVIMSKPSTNVAKRSRKEASHERIVDVAARAIRRSGYAGTGVADIMKEAGLTHGGFYAHFASRDALLAEAG